MCGRFIQSSEPESYANVLGFAISGSDAVRLKPRYNVAPTLPVLAIREENSAPAWALLRWGLVPYWSKGPDHRFSMINARAETLSQRAAFREPFQNRRCIIPADGFYEWRTECSGRQPYMVHRSDDVPLFFAGLWERWQGAQETVESCTIVVTGANAAVAPIHDRMPVALSRRGVRKWLDRRTVTEDLEGLLKSAPAELFDVYPVSMKVNNPRSEGPELIEPLAAEGPAR